MEDEQYLEEAQCRQALARAKAVAVAPGSRGRGATDQPTGDSTVLGEYQLLEKLGEGGMGTVYRARHTKLKRVVALKILPKRRAADDRAIARFEREMEAIGQLDHPNIVRALDAREVDGMHFLVMELVEGINLSELVQRLGPLPIPDACELVRQAACGLQYAYEHGQIHRDVKPSNLMLTTSGQVKILDLGLALFHGPHTEAAPELTDSGQMMGTFDYMAPEQGMDSHDVDIRADIYSLGATLYRLLCGHAPFSGKEYSTPVKKMMALATEPVPPIGERRPDVPDGLAAVLDRMLAQEPDARFSTPAEVVAALEPFTAGCDLPSVLAQAQETARSSGKTDKSLVATDELSSSALVGTQPSHRPEPRPAPLFAPSRWNPLAVAVGSILLAVGVVLAFQLIIRIRDKEGHETVIQIPEGTDAIVEQDGKELFRLPAPDKASKLEKPKPERINGQPEPLEWTAGDRLSDFALVTSPASLPGVLTWTIEPQEHSGCIANMAHSPDGQLLATAGTDATVRIWNASNQRIQRILYGHTDHIVSAVAWSPDSRYPASGSSDKTVRVWNATTGQQLRVLRGHEASVRAVVWSPDGKHVLSGSGDKTVRLWELPVGRQRLSVSLGGAVGAVAWSADGKHVAVGGADKTIQVRDADLKKLVHSLPHKGEVKSVAFSPDSRVLASADNSGTIYSWNVATGKRLHEEVTTCHSEGEGGKRDVYVVCFSSDGKYLATGGADQWVRVWDVESGFSTFDLKGHSNVVCALSWSPDGKTIASSSPDYSLRFWDVDTGELRHMAQGHFRNSWIRHVAWSPDGQTIALGESRKWSDDTNIWFWDANLKKPIRRFKDRPAERMSWSPDGKFLAAIRSTVFLLDGESAKTVRTLTKFGENADCYDWSPDGSTVAIGYGNRNVVHIVDVQSSRVLRTLEGHTKNVVDVAFAPNGKALATCGLDELTVKVWDLQSGDVLATAKPKHNRPGRIAWTTDSNRLALRLEWGIHIWEPARDYWHEYLHYGRMLPPNKPMVWHRDGKTLISDNVVWNVDTCQRVHTLEHPSKGSLGSLHNMYSLSWSPDDRLLAVGSFDPVVSVWEPRTGRLHATLLPLSHNEGTGLVFSPEGHYVVVGDVDVDNPIVYVVLTEDGHQVTFTPQEFAAKYGWKNDPEKVRLVGQHAVQSGQQAEAQQAQQEKPADEDNTQAQLGDVQGPEKNAEDSQSPIADSQNRDE